jgi:hypothetical protein
LTDSMCWSAALVDNRKEREGGSSRISKRTSVSGVTI